MVVSGRGAGRVLLVAAVLGMLGLTACDLVGPAGVPGADSLTFVP
jgi:hypothetical protein